MQFFFFFYVVSKTHETGWFEHMLIRLRTCARNLPWIRQIRLAFGCCQSVRAKKPSAVRSCSSALWIVPVKERFDLLHKGQIAMQALLNCRNHDTEEFQSDCKVRQLVAIYNFQASVWSGMLRSLNYIHWNDRAILSLTAQMDQAKTSPINDTHQNWPHNWWSNTEDGNMLNQKVLSSLQSSLIDGTFNFLRHVCRQAQSILLARQVLSRAW